LRLGHKRGIEMTVFGRPTVTILLLMGLVLTAAGCTFLEVNLGPRQAPLEETVVQGQGQAKVVLITISGVLCEERLRTGLLPWSPSESLLGRLTEELDRAAKDDQVKALLVKIDSPGGSVSTSDLVFHQLDRHRRQTGHKIVACLMGIAASGGYYAALAADRIVALPTSATGSVGVISLKFNLAGLMGRLGVEAETVTSGQFKDMWSIFRPASEEERRIIKSLIDDYFPRFKKTVQDRRPAMTARQLEKAATGRLLSAAQALDLGLIDGLAYPDQAFDQVLEMAGLEEARLVLYHRPKAHRPNIYAQTGQASPSLAGADLLNLSTGPHFMYIWLPGLR